MILFKDLKALYSISDALADLQLEIVGQKGTEVRCRCVMSAQNHQNGDKNPSMYVNLEKNFFKCHSCGVCGDQFHLLEYGLGKTRGEVWRYVNERLGYNQTNSSPAAPPPVPLAPPQKWQQKDAFSELCQDSINDCYDVFEKLGSAYDDGHLNVSPDVMNNIQSAMTRRTDRIQCLDIFEDPKLADNVLHELWDFTERMKRYLLENIQK